MKRYLRPLFLIALLALGLAVGAAAAAPMESFVPPQTVTIPSDPETDGEL